MLTIADKERKTPSDYRFSRLFPTQKELDERLISAMRTPLDECLTKNELLKRLSQSKK